jgi:hypothetical protein
LSEGRLSLSEVRERLKSQGYLETGLERAIFTAPRASGAILPSVLAGAAACAAASSAAAAVRGAVSPVWGVLLLFAALFLAELPLAAAAGALFYLGSRTLRVPQNPKRTSYLFAVAAAAGVFALFTLGVRSLPAGEGGHPVLASLLVAIAAFYFARAVRATSLSLALRRQVDLPAPPLFRLGAGAAVAVLLAGSSLVAWRSRRSVPFPALPVSSSARPPQVVVGLDGVSASQARAILPGEPAAAWTRPPAPPPEVWSTIATGVAPERHGVRAFERVSLLRLAAVRPPMGAGWAFRGPFRWLGAAGRLPVSGAERRAYAFWEVAARAGVPTLAVNWWASEPQAGAAVVDNSEIARLAGSGREDDAQAILRFARERARMAPRLAALYLPGADIGRGPLTEPARRFLEEELARARRGEESLWVVFDAGRSGDRGGLWVGGAGASNAVPAAAAPEDVAPSLLARLGIPPAADLAGAPLTRLFAPGQMDPRRVATYGTRISREPAGRPTEAGREYLQKLRSLGYLN